MYFKCNFPLQLSNDHIYIKHFLYYLIKTSLKKKSCFLWNLSFLFRISVIAWWYYVFSNCKHFWSSFIYVNVSVWLKQKGVFKCLKNFLWANSCVQKQHRKNWEFLKNVWCITILMYFFIFFPLPCIFMWSKI